MSETAITPARTLRRAALVAAFLVPGGVAVGALRGLVLARRLVIAEPIDPRFAAALDAAGWADRGVASLTYPSEAGPLLQWLAAAARTMGDPHTALLALAVLWGGLVGLGVAWAGREVWIAPRGLLAAPLIAIGALGVGLDAPLALAWWIAAMDLSRDRRSAGWRAGLALVVGCLWAPWSALPAFGACVAALVLGCPRRRLRGAGARAARVGCVFGCALAMLALSPFAGPFLTSALRVPMSPATAPVWVTLGVTTLFFAWTSRPSTGGPASAGTDGAGWILVPVSIAALGFGLQERAGTWPLVAVLVSTAVLAPSLTPPQRGTGWVLALTWTLGAVVAPSLSDLATVQAALRPTPSAIPDRAATWMRATIHRDGGCVATVGSLDRVRRVAAWSRVPGGAHPPSDCEWAVLRADPLRFDDDNEPFFGPRLVALVEGYAPEVRLGEGTSAWRRRDARAPVARRPLSVPTIERRAEVPGRIELALPEALSADALLSLEVEIDPALGLAPRSWIHFEGPGGPIDPPRPLVTGTRAYVAVSAAATARRWSTGARVPTPTADRLVITFSPRPYGAREVTVRVGELVELTPPPLALPALPARRRVSIAPGTDEVSASPGVTRAGDVDFSLHPTAAAPVWVDASVRPIRGSCLYAEVGLVEGSRASFDVVADLDERREVLTHRSVTPRYRQPFERSLDEFADRDVTFALVARSDDAVVQLHRVRIEPCVTLQSLVSDLHDGGAKITPPDARVDLEGDELRIPILDASVEPARVELPLRATAPGACLAVEVSARDHDGPVGVLVGLRRGASVWWLSRLVLEPGSAPVMQDELSLEAFADGPVTLLLSTWPYESAGGGYGVFTRPRVYRCGMRPPGWGF